MINMFLYRYKKQIAALGISVISAFILLTICSKSSFLYPLNDWVDANCFFTVGKSMANGMVIYRDIFEQKGPFLYVLHVLGYFISNDSFIGVYILEILSAAVFTFFAFKIMFLYNCSKGAFVVVPIFTALLFSSHAFCQGDSAEEFCLPFLMCGMYLMVKAIKSKKYFSSVELFITGALIGCVLWIKYTMLGFFIGMALVLLCWLIKQRLWKDLLKSICFVVLGLLVVSIPVIIYFGVNGALGDLFEVYFYNNMFLYSDSAENLSFLEKILDVSKNTVKSLILLFQNNIWMPLLILSGVAYGWFGGNRKLLFSLATVFVFTAFFIYGGGRHYDYYGLPLSVFALFGFVVFAQQAHRFLSVKRNALNLVYSAGSIALSVVISVSLSGNIESMSVEKEELPQYKFKEIIDHTENPTLLNYGSLDNGFYTVCNIVPNCKYFCGLNIPLDDIKEEQKNYVAQKKIDYIVTRGEKPDFDGYTCIASAQADYKDGKRTYYLHKIDTK